ncbi:leucine-rich repeat protein [Artemisia annua]|uniref:Cell wall hydroxyproline-rich glycoprotein n=1 Tax=Artemisia annua TaxID=35608 RepID=A0A2U1QEP1_ARTAN|nr:leucine-rich repeat protein [Artemisia annua]
MERHDVVHTIFLIVICYVGVTHQMPVQDGDASFVCDPSLDFENVRIKNAYIALQAWKGAILSDPHGVINNWVGSNVCNYTGVFCYESLDNPKERTVAGIDLNHQDLAGKLPEHLGLLYDLGIFHINSNRFCGTLPLSFLNFKILFELDLSNNRFAGNFPHFVLELPELKYLDIRFNEFEGELPQQLFNKNLDAILVNNNRFSSSLPENVGNSRASVIVLSNNKFSGCVPSSITKMTETLDELVLINNGFNSCLPETIGLLKNLSVLDLSYNRIKGELPSSIGEMTGLEVLNVAHNMLSGKIPESLCLLPNLDSFSYEFNFLVNQTNSCLKLAGFDDRRNCFKDRPEQRTRTQCGKYLSKPFNCSDFMCGQPLHESMDQDVIVKNAKKVSDIIVKTLAIDQEARIAI